MSQRPRRVVITRAGAPRRRRRGTIVLTVVMVAFFVIGALALGSGVRGVVMRRTESATTSGTVTDGGLCLGRSDIAATAQYRVEGHVYTTSNGDCAPKTGDIVTVRYDPADPARADFSAHPTANDVVAMVVGSLLILVALFFGTAPWWGPRVIRAVVRRTARRLGHDVSR